MRPENLSPHLLGARCFFCNELHDAHTLLSVCCRCGMPLRVEYDLSAVQISLRDLADRPPSLWRYRELLPLNVGEEVSLVEGFTPLVRVGRNTWVKDEARNPTGSFKARGMSLAVSMARALGAHSLCVPSAGNAAGALAAYGARAGVLVTVAMPADTPAAFVAACRTFGAVVHLVNGTIADAGAFLRAHGPKDAFDVATLHEPYRIEGKKTIAYELVEQFEGSVPDVIIFPTGGGTALIGMWKAFQEMQLLGWIPKARFPRFVCVQVEGCAPIAEAFRDGKVVTTEWQDPKTACYGIRVPNPSGGGLCLRVLRETAGTAIAVSEEEMQKATHDLSRESGIDVCPEGGAAWAALGKLRDIGFVEATDSVVLFNTAEGLKYR